MSPWSLVLALSVGIVCACAGDDGVGPNIDRVAPTVSAVGGQVEIHGARFCGDDAEVAADGGCVDPPPGFVNFGVDANVVRAAVVEWRDELIRVTVPESAAPGAGFVVVTVAGVTSNAVDFQVL